MIDPIVLRDSLETVLAKDDTFPKRFYELLFQRHPSVAKLFVRSSPGAQRKMFAQKLTTIVDHIEDAAWVERELRELQESHAGYGVTDEMYPWVGEALIDTLREALGDEFTPDVERNWREAYAMLTKAILASAP